MHEWLLLEKTLRCLLCTLVKYTGSHPQCTLMTLFTLRQFWMPTKKKDGKDNSVCTAQTIWQNLIKLWGIQWAGRRHTVCKAVYCEPEKSNRSAQCTAWTQVFRKKNCRIKLKIFLKLIIETKSIKWWEIRFLFRFFLFKVNANQTKRLIEIHR